MNFNQLCCCSAAESCPTLYDPMDCVQHTRLPCPPLSPGVCSGSCPLSQWCHPTISSSATLFSSCPQSFLASWSFPMSWFFTPGGQSIGATASASVLPMNIQSWFPLGLTGLISLLFRNFLQHHSLKASILWNSVFFMELIELKTFSTKKEIINKKKRQPSKWWKIFANEATIKDYISKIYKQLMLLNIKKNI